MGTQGIKAVRKSGKYLVYSLEGHAGRFITREGVKREQQKYIEASTRATYEGRCSRPWYPTIEVRCVDSWMFFDMWGTPQRPGRIYNSACRIHERTR
jgi:hypothetical protein